MFTSMLSAVVLGVECHGIRVEADVSDGLPVFNMVGFLSTQAREAQDRVKTALRNAEYFLPAKRITINLAPGDLRKEGTGFDLPVALTILASLGRISSAKLEHVMAVGELSLDGKVGAMPGILAIVMKAKELGCEACMIPRKNLREGSMVEGIKVIGVDTLTDAVEYFNFGKNEWKAEGGKPQDEQMEVLDFSDIQGQETAKRAAVIAVSGFHNLLFIGPPGVGKSMLAKRICGILPPLTKEESLEITRIYSIMGLLPENSGLMTQRPFRAPHHTASKQALSGGGKIPRPGEITLAHKGVLFLDELPEFSAGVLDTLRQPLESHQICISRASGSYTFPAHCMVVCAMNPCSCGNYPDMNKCTCRPEDISRYLRKISRPMLDRIDICAEVSRISYQEAKVLKQTNTSSQMRKQVEEARIRQKERFEGTDLSFNSQIPPQCMTTYCPMTPEGERMLELAYKKMDFSVRGYHRILKTARTIADLDGEDIIGSTHIGEAICYRTLDEKYWK